MPNHNFSALAKNQKAFPLRIIRQERVLNHTRALHPAAIVVQLRREERQLQKDFWSAATPAERQAAYRPLITARDRILEIIGWPKPPTLRLGQSASEAMRPKASRMELAIETTSSLDSVAPPNGSAPP